jgi:tetratricopeptide (TPR) repeat protein
MKRAMACSLSLLALAAALAAQENLGRGRISGEVVDEAGAGIPGVAVTAQIVPGTTTLESRTDKKGHFAVAGLGSGTWRVSAAKEGYVSAYTELPVSQLKTNPPIKLTMKRVAAAAAPSGADEKAAFLLERGGELLGQERYDEALASFEEFAARYPAVYGVRLNIATVYMKKGDLERAEAEFRGVLEKAAADGGDAAKARETSLRALSGLGEAALMKGDLEAAQTAFRRALEISPEDAAAAYNVGEIFFSNQRVDEAVAYFEMAAKIKPEWPKPYHRIGLAWLNKGDFDKALAGLRKFVEMAPDDPQTEGVRATIAAVEKMRK